MGTMWTPQPTRCNAVLAAAYTSGSTTVKVKNVQALDGLSPVSSNAEELDITVYFDNWPDADAGTKCKIERNAPGNRWELYQMDC